MEIIYQIGTILFWPFTNFLIGELVWLVSVVVMIVLAKKQHTLKSILFWWFLGIIIFGIISSIIGSLAHQGGGFLSDSTGANPFFIIAGGLLWLLYFPIIGMVYLSIKSSQNRNSN
ncbi:MAG: hypothetical protein Q8R08_04340 [bacterium]|nr:hypothetical protein [bacterium]